MQGEGLRTSEWPLFHGKTGLGPRKGLVSIQLRAQSAGNSDRPGVKLEMESELKIHLANEGVMNSETILARARQLDPHVLAGIHDEFYPVVYRYVRYRLDDEQVCEDIAAEVFLRLLDALHQKKGPSQNLQGWLLGTTSHLINDYLRHRYVRGQESLEEQNLVSHQDTESLVDQSWQKQEIRAAIGRLTEEQQHVLALRFSDDRSLEETADMMGKSIGAVKTLQFRALASLRRILEGKHKE
jgi:RNA polymerase sigma-70 factor, ECF subfamily